MSESPLEAEVSGATVEFKFFDRAWVAPAKRRLSHIKRMRDELRSGIGSIDLMVAETFLSPEDFDALCEIDPDEDQLDAFVGELSKAMGLDKGNS